MTAATPLRSAADPADPAPIEPLSKRWLGLDWSTHLPWDIGGYAIELGSLDDVIGFVGRWYADIFGSDADEGRFFAEPMTPAKRRVLAESDLFVIRDADEIVGLQVAAPTDWSTYYIRSLVLLPNVRGRGLVGGITRAMQGPLLSAGVARLEYDTSPANAANLALGSRLGYLTTGMLNSDRWGSLLRRTLYLNVAAEDAFRGQFCAGSRPPRRAQASMGAEGGSP